MQLLFRKYAWIMKFIIVGIVAILLAVALNRVAAIFLAPLTVPEIALDNKTKNKTKKVSSRLKNFSNPIKSRCLFGCLEDTPVASATGCSDGCKAGETCQDDTCVPISQDTSSLPVASDIGAKLLGAMVAGNPDFSTALLVAGEQTYVVGIGEKILDGEIVEIRRDRIIIQRNGRLEYLKLENTINGNPSAARNSATASAIARASRGSMDIKPTSYPELRPSIPNIPKKSDNSGVKKISATEFQLDQAFLEKELSNTGKLASQVSIAPNYDAAGAKQAGIKMMGIRSGSVFNKLGIQSNDVVKKINGTKVQNQSHALGLLNKLKGKSNASIEVERKGASTVLKYKVKK